MKPAHKGFLIGCMVALVIAGVAARRYGEWKGKIGWYRGFFDGNVAVINELARHFPRHSPGNTDALPIFGTKYYVIWLTESNGVRTLEIKNEE